MTDTIKNDYQLDQYAAAAARDIVDEIKRHGGEAYDMAREHANGCEYVIYYHHAHSICKNCNVSVSSCRSLMRWRHEEQHRDQRCAYDLGDR